MPTASDLEKAAYLTEVYRKNHAEMLPVIGEPRPDLVECVISFPGRLQNAIPSSMSTYFVRNMNSNVGILGLLPLEMFVEVILSLDLVTLFKFRQTSQHACNTVSSLPAFRACISLGRGVLCALMRTGFASKVSLKDFDTALRSRDCTFCGKFAGFVTLMPWKRCCYRCVLNQEDVALVNAYSLQGVLDGDKIDLVDHLQSFNSLVGYYGIMLKCPEQKLVKYQDAARLVDKKSHPQFRNVYRYLAYMGAVAMPWLDVIGRVVHGVGCVGCNRAATDPDSLLNANDYDAVFAGKDVLYSPEGLLEHFKVCKLARGVWMAWQNGLWPLALEAPASESSPAPAVKI